MTTTRYIYPRALYQWENLLLVIEDMKILNPIFREEGSRLF